MNTASPQLLLLAAGASSRFGSPKQQAPIDGEPMLRRAARIALAAGAPVTVVLGAHAETLQRLLDGLTLRVAVHAGWARGLGSSIAFGVRQLPETAPVLLCLADQPLLRSADLAGLLARHHARPQTLFAAAYAGTLGPPCLFPAGLHGELAALDGRAGARALLQRHAERVEAVPMPAAATDVDRPEDLSRLFPD